MNRLCKLFLLLSCCFFFHNVSAQYILNGDATQVSCNCYTLTTEEAFKSGSVWNSHKIDLTKSFDFWFNVYLGCKDANGADGMVFILQPISTSIGGSGGGMGFDGINPSIGIALDTWQNPQYSDPPYDHISIQKNGNPDHLNDLVPLMPASATSDNIEDCKWHVLRITWNAATKNLATYFDGVARVQAQVDLVSAIFNNDPNVYWGFSAATGGSNNIQQFCTALNPDFTTSLTANTGCAPATVQFNDHSVSFAPIVSYSWKFSASDSSNSFTPKYTFQEPGVYPVHLTITGLDGCTNDTVRNITIGSMTSAAFTINDTCFTKAPILKAPASGIGIQYKWNLDGSSSTQQPSLTSLPTGNHTISMTASSQYNCGQPMTATHNFRIKPVPSLGIVSTQVCKEFTFTGVQNDNQAKISEWIWSFGDGKIANAQNTTHTYTDYRTYPVALWANAEGCISDTVHLSVQIKAPLVSAGKDTVLMRNKPGQLNGWGNGHLKWQPSFGLSNDTLANPIATLSADQSYMLSVLTDQGCTANGFVNVKVYDGPQVYVPNAFTPNGDGLNDVLKPVYVGMTKLEQFSVFNRWGQVVFSTSDPGKGWDGKLNQKPVASGTYVWMIKATDYLNSPVLLKGTVTIIQ